MPTMEIAAPTYETMWKINSPSSSVQLVFLPREELRFVSTARCNSSMPETVQSNITAITLLIFIDKLIAVLIMALIAD